jgi:hypothetical protein
MFASGVTARNSKPGGDGTGRQGSGGGLGEQADVVLRKEF